MLRKLTSYLLILTLCWTTVACNSSPTVQSQQRPVNNTTNTTAVRSNQVTSGRFPVQQATYNDADGTYTLMLLNTPAGTSPTFETSNLQMARLTDEQIGKGETTSVEINGDSAVMYLTEDFKIEYVHNVTQVQENPQTGQRETVVVRQESNFWSPFAGALAGQALGSLLFRPQFYVPPMYQTGVPLTGYGGFGSTYSGAVDQYRSVHNAPPPAVKNRQTLRTTGNIRRYPSSTNNTVRKPATTGNKSTGSGFGSSQLRPSNKSNSSKIRRAPSFGSSGTRRSFGSRRR